MIYKVFARSRLLRIIKGAPRLWRIQSIFCEKPDSLKLFAKPVWLHST